MNERPILLAAGGTGGHLFPAEALAHALAARGVPAELVTDERALRYGATFPARAMHTIPSATPRGGNILARAQAVASLAIGTAQAVTLLRRVQPRAVIGFGGYPTVPPLLAAAFLGLPTAIHEANAIMGKANRFLSGRVDRIAAGFPNLNAPEALKRKVVVTGNPVRPNVIEAAQIEYPAIENGMVRLLVTGGSQGARIMADIVPEAVVALPEAVRARLAIVQQTRPEDMERVRTMYSAASVDAELAPFFSDLPARIAQAHFVIARSGASTVSELAVIGRPSLLVPLPQSLDGDQAANAKILEEAGAAEVTPQARFTPAFLTERLMELVNAPAELSGRAQAARRAGVADAAERLADLIITVAQSGAAQRRQG